MPASSVTIAQICDAIKAELGDVLVNSGNLVRADNYGDIFRINPERPDYKTHPLLQGALNSLPIPKELELDISIHSEVPAGSSTGTSASVCVV